MSRRSTILVKAALSALHYSGAGRLAPQIQSAGAILTLHQVCPDPPAPFSPNRILKISPQFLAEAIEFVIDNNFDVLTLDEVHERVAGLSTGAEASSKQRPFVAFTLDDGYRDNLQIAYPVFKKYGVPFAIYVPTDYPDGKGEIWWHALEQALSRLSEVTVRFDQGPETFKLTTTAEKDAAYHRIYWWLRSIDERRARTIVRTLAENAGINIEQLCRDLIMTWDEIRSLAKDPLVTFGAHTRRHFALAKLPLDEAQAEIVFSIERLAKELGRPVRHFSYPFGDATSAGGREFKIAEELGLLTAMTTRKGLIDASHANALTALPRVSLNGDYQDQKYLQVLLSGLPFRMLQAARKLLPRPAAAAGV